MRVAFAIENQLGHRTFLSNLRSALLPHLNIDPVWLPLDPTGTSLLERLPRVRDKHALIFGLKARKLLKEAEASGRLDACFMHTQRMAHFAVDLMHRLPTFLSIDATPIELDAIYNPLMGVHSARGSVYWRIRDAIHRRTYRAARGIVTMSETVAASLVSAYRVNREEVLVLWPGVDTDKWRPSPVQSANQECRILFVGYDFQRKGGDLLLRWAKETGRRDFRLDVVTDHPLESVPRMTVHTHFAPNQPGLVELVQQAHLLVLPTRADLSPWVIAEAKAAGTPVISTQVGAIPELIRDGVDGWLIPPNDYNALVERLDDIVDDRARLSEFSRRAREDALQRFNASANAAKLVQFIEERIRLHVN
jgi:glycosyltransferase involved in cell wall biosynthesis